MKLTQFQLLLNQIIKEKIQSFHFIFAYHSIHIPKTKSILINIKYTNVIKIRIQTLL